MNTITTTASGIKFNYAEPTPDMINIRDIAHGLSRTCRWGGHVKEFFSVAQHSVNMARVLHKLGPTMQMYGLLHDATEAYMCDLPSPLKSLFPSYKRMEKDLLGIILEKYGLSLPIPNEVWEADNRMCETERSQVHNFYVGKPYVPPASFDDRECPESSHEPYNFVIRPWKWGYANFSFMRWFMSLQIKLGQGTKWGN